MSLTSFLELPDVTAKVKPFCPKLSRKIPAKLRVEPKSNRFQIVGTAFDYLLRFELQRRAPHAVSKRWVAEHVPGIMWKADEGAVSFTHLWKDHKGVISPVTGPDPGIGVMQEPANRAASLRPDVA